MFLKYSQNSPQNSPSFSASKKICIKIGKDTFKSRISPCSNQAELNEIKINDNHEIFDNTNPGYRV
jgi:hypothetical protein